MSETQTTDLHKAIDDAIAEAEERGYRRAWAEIVAKAGVKPAGDIPNPPPHTPPEPRPRRGENGQRVLAELKAHGPKKVVQLAEALDIKGPSVRASLLQLQMAKKVTVDSLKVWAAK